MAIEGTREADRPAIGVTMPPDQMIMLHGDPVHYRKRDQAQRRADRIELRQATRDPDTCIRAARDS